MLARPYDTIETNTLDDFLTNVLAKEPIGTIVVGYPKTMRGTESEQTKKTKALFDNLEKTYPAVSWALWDERLTSQQAARLKPAKTKEAKKQSHAIAAALILESYLSYKYILEGIE